MILSGAVLKYAAVQHSQYFIERARGDDHFNGLSCSANRQTDRKWQRSFFKTQKSQSPGDHYTPPSETARLSAMPLMWTRIVHLTDRLSSAAQKLSRNPKSAALRRWS